MEHVSGPNSYLKDSQQPGGRVKEIRSWRNVRTERQKAALVNKTLQQFLRLLGALHLYLKYVEEHNRTTDDVYQHYHYQKDLVIVRRASGRRKLDVLVLTCQGEFVYKIFRKEGNRWKDDCENMNELSTKEALRLMIEQLQILPGDVEPIIDSFLGVDRLLK